MATPRAMTEKRVAKLNAAVPELLGSDQVGERLGVAASNLDRIKDLPAEAMKMPRGRLWRADVIESYARARAARGKNNKRK
jgi:hypothetical protein